MLLKQLTYGNQGFNEIQEFLKQNYHKNYTLSIYNICEQSTAEIICAYEDMLDVIVYVTNMEHDFPSWCRITEYLSKNKRRNGRKKENMGYGGNRRNYWGYGGF